MTLIGCIAGFFAAGVFAFIAKIYIKKGLPVISVKGKAGNTNCPQVTRVEKPFMTEGHTKHAKIKPSGRSQLTAGKT